MKAVKIGIQLTVDGNLVALFKKDVPERLGMRFEDTTFMTALEKVEEVLSAAAPENADNAKQKAKQEKRELRAATLKK